VAFAAALKPAGGCGGLVVKMRLFEAPCAQTKRSAALYTDILFSLGGIGSENQIDPLKGI
jgi:hypothetical protein